MKNNSLMFVKPLMIAAVLIFAYFLVFPFDLEYVTAIVINLLSKIVKLSAAASPWLYVLISVVIISRTVTCIWGKK